MISRRGLILGGGAALIAAPSIVRASSLMKLKGVALDSLLVNAYERHIVGYNYAKLAVVWYSSYNGGHIEYTNGERVPAGAIIGGIPNWSDTDRQAALKRLGNSPGFIRALQKSYNVHFPLV